MLRGRVALSDPKIAGFIEKNYVVAVGEHMQLTRGELRDWFLPEVRRANPQYAGASTQGYYLLTADGKAYAFDNYPPRLPTYLETGVARFRRMPKVEAGITDADIRKAAPKEPPAGASVLRVYSRACADGSKECIAGTYLARDYMWVLQDEVRAIVRAGETAREFAMPPALVGRLVTFHMVDGTRGQVWPWRPDATSKAVFRAKPAGNDGSVRKFTFTGGYAKQDSHPPQWSDRGDEGTLEGEFEIDTRSMQFTRFRAYGEGKAWSDATYSPVSPPPRGRYTMLRAIVEANDELARQVTPEPAGTGQYYLRGGR